MHFYKYHALGNDYLVVRASELRADLDQSGTRRICHRNFGLGSDGILIFDDKAAGFNLRIINPDGSEAKKSGNGLRIFSRYLWDSGLVSESPFVVKTLGGDVRCIVRENGRQVSVDMGCVSFLSDRIPVSGRSREVLDEEIELDGTRIKFCGATIGNPHCVVINQRATEQVARRFGPLLEVHELFPNRTNVQFMEVVDRKNIKIEIWERGAGYTLASGSSSSASVAVAHRLGWVDKNVRVNMPGGVIDIAIGDDFSINMTGPVTRVAAMELDKEALDW